MNRNKVTREDRKRLKIQKSRPRKRRQYYNPKVADDNSARRTKATMRAATRWGIAGAGKISDSFATSVETLPRSEHELVAVAARELDRAKSFADAHEIPRAYGSYEELANDEDVGVVYIGTINTTHFEIGKLMLNAGKHVLCEKPMTMNLKQTKELIELARSKGLFLMEAIWSRCFPAYETLRQEIANKSIGDVKQVIASFGFKMTPTGYERVRQKQLGGGTILDMGVYVIQLACLAFDHDKPTDVKSLGHLNEDGVDASMSATLTYSNGRTATILTSVHCTLPNEAQIIGTEGMITLPQFWCPTKIVLPNGDAKEVRLPKPKRELQYDNMIGLVYEADEVRDCLRRGLKESPKVTHANSLLIAEIEDELRRQIGVVYDVD